jgi:hypothetical protein
VTLRRTAFGRYAIVRKPPTAMALARRVGLGLEVRQPSTAVMADCAAAAPSQPKTEPQRSPYLLAMAKGQSCVLRIEDVCNRDPATVVAAHSNLSIHGKGGARKADDQYHVYACSACHRWLDQGPAPAAIKECAFMAAHLWMVDIWRGIVAEPSQPAKDRAAAQWALDRLNASPVGLESSL